MKRIGIIVLLALMLALPLGSVQAAEASRVYDDAGLFTMSEVSALNDQISAFQEETGMDFVVLTSDENVDDEDVPWIIESFYYENDFGLDGEKSGTVYYINMTTRYHRLFNNGMMMDYMSVSRIDGAIARCKGALAAGDCARAASQMLSILAADVKSGIPEEKYSYDVLTGQHVTDRHKSLTRGEMLVCAAAGVLIAIIFAAVINARYKLKGSTYSYGYRENSDRVITNSEDTYLRTTVTRTRKAEPSSGKSGGGGGGTTSRGGGGHF